MRQVQVTTVTSGEFVRNASAAKRFVTADGHVIVTDRGEPYMALIPIADYQRLTKIDGKLFELLCMPEADAINADFEPIRIDARGIHA